ncbi:phosphoenolpyruvate--protein phosphotransferase [Diplocloster modestus]|uniref:Phosphoenolpyruvate-protein phosphotransferase n=1 Tax=Diplocloster modestus TaxID=2850322 RepID=A0ABS6K759_9FIRM|nr:phosphoenolpyruvate--protein phosphotransferase [Diplocloster modestus]
MKIWNCGKIASEGYASGPAFLVCREKRPVRKDKIREEEIEGEIRRFEQAVETGREQLQKLLAAEAQSATSEQAGNSAIFAGHLDILTDCALHEEVTGRIVQDLENAQRALQLSADHYAGIFETMDDAYMRERADDIRDVTQRLMLILQGAEETAFDTLRETSVVVARDLTPSDTIRMNMKLVAGIITEKGGITSHVGIIARNRGIPCLVCAGPDIREIRGQEQILLDAQRGSIITSPGREEKEVFLRNAAAYREMCKKAEESAALPCITMDGRKLSICANAGSPEEAEQAAAYDVDGIGLFRSEFLYMQQGRFPTEDEQFQAYQSAVHWMKGREVTIRTLDIGGDKGLDYFQIPKEDNPFLGCRAIRICLNRPDIFKTQLRAILRASAFGRVRILFPMITSLEELEKAQAILGVCKDELSEEGRPFDKGLETGIMIETPAAVLLAQELASRVDFFSIGTNDLTQYILAADRGNPAVATLYNPFHPAVLRSIQHVIRAGHEHHIPVGMCGELAGNIEAARLLLGMGLDEFSMSASGSPRIKQELRAASCESAMAAAAEVLKSPYIVSG